MKKINQQSYKKALKWIITILKRNKIKFNVLGGLAAYSYGSKRMLFDIDFSMSYKDMLRLSKIAKSHVVEKPWRGLSSTGQWKGGYMELNYGGIAIEIGEAGKTPILNAKTKKWEKFPDNLSKTINKRVFGMVLPIMPKKSLISYKSKLMRDVDKIDIKNLK